MILFWKIPMKVSEIAKTVASSDERVYIIFTEELGMRKLSARWVLHLLTTDKKQHFNASFSGMFTPF